MIPKMTPTKAMERAIINAGPEFPNPPPSTREPLVWRAKMISPMTSETLKMHLKTCLEGSSAALQCTHEKPASHAENKDERNHFTNDFENLAHG